jgi:hypothetical protein
MFTVVIIMRHSELEKRTSQKTTLNGTPKKAGIRLKTTTPTMHFFCATEFVQDCVNKGQTIKYSGAGTYHKNGVTERLICTVTAWVQAIMLHSIIHWPAEAQPDIWPMALDQAKY